MPPEWATGNGPLDGTRFFETKLALTSPVAAPTTVDLRVLPSAMIFDESDLLGLMDFGVGALIVGADTRQHSVLPHAPKAGPESVLIHNDFVYIVCEDHVARFAKDQTFASTTVPHKFIAQTASGAGWVGVTASGTVYVWRDGDSSPEAVGQMAEERPLLISSGDESLVLGRTNGLKIGSDSIDQLKWRSSIEADFGFYSNGWFVFGHTSQGTRLHRFDNEPIRHSEVFPWTAFDAYCILGNSLFVIPSGEAEYSELSLRTLSIVGNGRISGATRILAAVGLMGSDGEAIGIVSADGRDGRFRMFEPHSGRIVEIAQGEGWFDARLAVSKESMAVAVSSAKHSYTQSVLITLGL